MLFFMNYTETNEQTMWYLPFGKDSEFVFVCVLTEEEIFC